MTGGDPEPLLRPSKRLEQSEEYLLSKHNALAAFGDVADLATDEERLSEKDRGSILHHLLVLRSAIARALWNSGIYVGVSVLDECVLGAVKAGQPRICDTVIDGLRQAGADRQGFVLYPLIRFGLEMPGLFQSGQEPWASAVFPEAGFAVTAQSHSLDNAFGNMNAMAAALGIQACADRGSIEHNVRAGNMTWFTRNPLMMVRLASHTGAYYENQFIYTLKIRIAAAQVLMLHALMVEAGLAVGKFESSAEVNNSETLDIGHYLIGEAVNDQSLQMRRVPMNVAALDLARLSDLAVTLSSSALKRPEVVAMQQLLTPQLKSLESGYLRYVNMTSGEKVHSRVYRRLATAVEWYGRSFGSRTKEAEAIVALAVAFETLLTDHYAPGGAARIARRIGLCIPGNEHLEKYKSSVVEVYHARSEIVHTGDGGHEIEIQRAQAAFALCFCEVASRLAVLTRNMSDPIRELLGDVLTPEERDAKAAAGK